MYTIMGTTKGRRRDKASFSSMNSGRTRAGVVGSLLRAWAMHTGSNSCLPIEQIARSVDAPRSSLSFAPDEISRQATVAARSSIVRAISRQGSA